MKVFVYKNGLCDPARNIGTCRLFYSSKDVDEYVNMFCASIDPKYLSNWRILITNDNVEFAAVDHFVLFGEHLGAGDAKTIREVDVPSLANDINEHVIKLRVRREAAVKRLDELKNK